MMRAWEVGRREKVDVLRVNGGHILDFQNVQN